MRGHGQRRGSIIGADEMLPHRCVRLAGRLPLGMRTVRIKRPAQISKLVRGLGSGSATAQCNC